MVFKFSIQKPKKAALAGSLSHFRTNKTISVALFPGQGSQFVGMANAENKNYFDRASEILNLDLYHICANGPEEKLREAQIAQVAILTSSIFFFDNFRKLENNKIGIRFDYYCGHSLGEYTALYAAGLIDFESVIKLVYERGKVMAEVSNILHQELGMCALIGSFQDKNIIEIKNNLKDLEIDIANFNSPQQIVLSGKQQDLEKIKINKKNIKRIINLKVSSAFHSRFMKDAAIKFFKSLDQIKFKNLDKLEKINILSNVTARPIRNLKGLEELRKLLVRQIYEPVDFMGMMNFLKSEINYEGFEFFEFIEYGSKKVLSPLVKQNFYI